MASAPIFVVGPPRTGTTLTARLLSRHSAVHMSPVELFYFQRVYERRHRLGTPDGSDAVTAKIEETLKKVAYKKRREREYWQALDKIFADPAFNAQFRQARSYGEILDSFMTAQAKEFGKTRWGNQVPSDLFALDEIMTFFPDARVIVCTRHPLDFLVSNRDTAARALRRNNLSKARRNKASYHPVLASLLWRLCMRQGDKAKRAWPDQVMFSRYEDLVQAPDAQVERLCEFVGITYEPAMLEVQVHNSSRDIAQQGIFKSSIGQWRTALDPDDAYTCQALCRKYMSRRGYEPADLGLRLGGLIGRLASAPAAGVRLLRRKPKEGDGAIPFSLKRILG